MEQPEHTLGIEGSDMKLRCGASKPEGFAERISFTWEKNFGGLSGWDRRIENSKMVR